jgi:hypothetical protein
MCQRYHKFSVFFPFFRLFLSSACRGCLACLFGFSCRGLPYLFIWLAWQTVAVSLFRCVADRARVCVFGVSRVSFAWPSSDCRCCRFCRFVCVCPFIGGGGSHPVAGSLAGCQALEQVFETSVRLFFRACFSECFQPNPDRIFAFWRWLSNRILTEPNRISNRIRTESFVSVSRCVFNRIF